MYLEIKYIIINKLEYLFLNMSNYERNKPFMNLMEQFTRLPENYVLDELNKVSAETVQKTAELVDEPQEHFWRSAPPMSMRITSVGKKNEIDYLQRLITGTAPVIKTAHSLVQTQIASICASDILENQSSEKDTENNMELDTRDSKEEPATLFEYLTKKYRIISEYSIDYKDVYSMLIVDTLSPEFQCIPEQDKYSILNGLKIECLSSFKKEDVYGKGAYTTKDFKKSDLDSAIYSK